MAHWTLPRAVRSWMGSGQPSCCAMPGGVTALLRYRWSQHAGSARPPPAEVRARCGDRSARRSTTASPRHTLRDAAAPDSRSRNVTPAAHRRAVRRKTVQRDIARRSPKGTAPDGFASPAGAAEGHRRRDGQRRARPGDDPPAGRAACEPPRRAAYAGNRGAPRSGPACRAVRHEPVPRRDSRARPARSRRMRICRPRGGERRSLTLQTSRVPPVTGSGSPACEEARGLESTVLFLKA